jgi:hypothetical protein
LDFDETVVLEFYQWGSEKQPGAAMLVGCLSQPNRRFT